MSIELYHDARHKCVMFSDLIEEGESAVQSNQFIIVDNNEGVIIDPGGNNTYNELLLTISKFIPVHSITYLLASHADPDIIASLDRWLTSTDAKLVISRVWERFVPHFTRAGKTNGRILGVPDEGGRLRVGKTELLLIPAHFMHSEGNFHFYDPISRILFTGDLGVSLTSGKDAMRPVTELGPHIVLMEAFHRRYMVANKILRHWANMVRKLDIAMIVPQHGAPISGPKAVEEFLCWLEGLSVGVDLFDERNYQLPIELLMTTDARS